MKKEEVEKIIVFLTKYYKKYVSSDKRWEATWCRDQIEMWQDFYKKLTITPTP